MSILQKVPPGLSTTQAINVVADQVKDLLYQLSKTISSIKVFSWEHLATQKMVHVLWENAAAFLARFGRLEIGVEEFAFTYRDRVVYRDEKAIKSLPFLFYKDGMKQLFIDKTLKEDELVEFLKIIREAFEKPAEECDIVNLLWEKDLASIHCYAPDDFLEAKIGEGKQPPMLYADPADLRMGFIPLTQEDMTPAENFMDSTLELPVPGDDGEGTVPGPDQDSAGAGPSPEGQVFVTLSDQENKALREMLQINRRQSPNSELVIMAGEILHLEANPTRFLEALDVVSRLHQDLVGKADFLWAAQLLARMLELKSGFAAPNAFQREPVAAFIDRLKTRTALTNLRAVILEKKPSDYRPFFEYVTLLGLETLPLVIDLCDTLRSPAFYAAIGVYLREIGTQSPSQLLHLASATRPALTREVIAALGSHPDKRVVLLLAAFKGDWDLTIKQDAIRALARSAEPAAVRVLCDFLNDNDLDVRVFAANNIRLMPDAVTSDHIASLIRSKDFQRKSLLERQAYLDLAGRQNTFEMRDLLEGILRKRSGLFNRRRRTETRLAVVATLARQADAEAREILEHGTRAPGGRVRRACREALDSLPELPKPRPAPRPERAGKAAPARAAVPKKAAPQPSAPAVIPETPPVAPQTVATAVPEPAVPPPAAIESAPEPATVAAPPPEAKVGPALETPPAPAMPVEAAAASQVWPESMSEFEPESQAANPPGGAPKEPVNAGPVAEAVPAQVPEPQAQPPAAAAGPDGKAGEGPAPGPLPAKNLEPQPIPGPPPIAGAVTPAPPEPEAVTQAAPQVAVPAPPDAPVPAPPVPPVAGPEEKDDGRS